MLTPYEVHLFASYFLTSGWSDYNPQTAPEFEFDQRATIVACFCWRSSVPLPVTIIVVLKSKLPRAIAMLFPHI